MMRIQGADPETLLIRTTVISAALQALVGRLMSNGALDHGDLVAMREVGMELAADLSAQPGMADWGVKMGKEVEAWWGAAGALGGT